MDDPSANAADRAAPVPFDAIYKALFGHRATVADMLRNFLTAPAGPVPADLPAALDHRTLRRLPAEWVTRDFRSRRGDAVWCARFRDAAVRAGWPARLFLHLEFQSTNDPDMALRFQEYGAELFRELRTSGILARAEPCPILCVAVHNGRQPWRAPTRAADLVRLPAAFGNDPAPPGLAAFYPWGYHPLDLARLRHEPPRPGSVVSALIAIEYAGPGNLATVVGGPLRNTARAMGPALRAVVAAWLRRLAAGYRIELPELEDIMRFEEPAPVTSRLEETLDAAFAKARSEGIKRGRAEERERGRAEERELILAQAARKFGRPAVGKLAEPLQSLTTPESLRQAGFCIVECASAAEMLARIRDLGNRAGDRVGPH